MTEPISMDTKVEKRKYRVGVIDLETYGHGSPDIVLESIRKAKKHNLDLLVGPEWSLSAPGDGTGPRAYPYGEAKSLIDLLKTETIGSDMLVVPGTFVYFKDLADVKEKFIANSAEISLKHPEECEREINPNDIKNGIVNIKRGPFSKIFPSKRFVGYDYMPVLSNGKIVYSLTKEENGGTGSFLGKRTIRGYIPKSRKFEFSGLSFGAEICSDAGRLRREDVKNLDVQIVSLCGQLYSPPNVLREGGVYVYSNGYGFGSEPGGKTGQALIGKIKSGRLIPLDPIESDGRLEIFETDL